MALKVRGMSFQNTNVESSSDDDCLAAKDAYLILGGGRCDEQIQEQQKDYVVAEMTMDLKNG